MRRVYHDYRRWEDYKNGMWRSVTAEEYDSLLDMAVNFTGDHIKYGAAMLKVIKKWKYSCEHNLTDTSINRRAWVGHAACSFEMSLPESVVRDAWKLLTEEQRKLANRQADIAIFQWNKMVTHKTQLTLW